MWHGIRNCMEIVWKCGMELGNHMEIAGNLEIMWKYHGNNMEFLWKLEITCKWHGNTKEVSWNRPP